MNIGRFAALPFVALLGGCGSDSARSTFETVAVSRGDVRDVVPAVGEIRDETAMAVPITAEAQVTGILVTLGQHVSKGALLATLTPTIATDEPAEVSADIAQARIAREIALNGYAKEAATFAGLRQLHDRGFVPDARLTAETKELETRRLELSAADRKVSALQERLQRVSGRRAERDKLRAPCDCVVEDINITRGQTVGPTLTDAFYLSGTGSELTIRTKVAEQDLPRIQAASSARFSVEALPDRQFPATVRYIGNRPLKDGRFTYYTVYLQFSREDVTIRPGMTADVEFVNADSRNVLSVPISALYYKPPDYVPVMSAYVQQVYRRAVTPEDRRVALAMADGAEFGQLWREGRRKVFVLENGRPVRRLVRVGAETSDNFEVASGLKAGELVVLGTRRQR